MKTIIGVLGMVTLLMGAGPAAAQTPEVTYTRDIAPFLQRSCEKCHRVDGVAPMPLSTYEQVRPWARAIKTRTGIGPRAGVMPPWYVEKDLGIQHFKDDPSLSAEEILKIARWADAGAPMGNPADMPPAKDYGDNTAWAIGTPDLVVKMQDIVVKGGQPDWWGEVPSASTGLDRTGARTAASMAPAIMPGVDVANSMRLPAP